MSFIIGAALSYLLGHFYEELNARWAGKALILFMGGSGIMAWVTLLSKVLS